jgi:UDP-N-acetylmuramoyl-tripeptide--D-alanyl-D-alanine ligase
LESQRRQELPVGRWISSGVACVAVPDTIRALGDLAGFRRKRLPVSIVAVTGSNGKTSTRNLTREVMQTRFRILSTSGNFNNHIGLPLTLFQLTEDHQWAVLELGMNHPGEIDRLAEICRPQIGIITNIAPAHLQGLRSLDGIMTAKGELLSRLDAGGVAVMNLDDSRVAELARLAPCPVLGFGIESSALIHASHLSPKPDGTRFCLHLPDQNLEIFLQIPGRFMVYNALAAAAAGYAAGVRPEEIQTGLANARPVPGRMNLIHTGRRIHIIDDTYNANPGSTEAAIRTLESLAGSGRKFLVLGDMLELGDQAAGYHRQIGRIAGETQPAGLFVTGDFADIVADAAREAGMTSDSVRTGSKPAIMEELRALLQSGDWVLIKGSRGMTMETVVQELHRQLDTGPDTHPEK